MTREEAKKLLPIIKAFSEEIPIQYRMKDNKTAIWNDVDKNYHEFSPHSFQYRIKPKKVERIDKKYISGDFVYIYGSLRIINNCDGYYATYYDEEETLQEVNVDVIEGVPLTPEILKENGWVKDKENCYINYIYHLHICGKNNRYSVYKVEKDNVVWLTGIEKVSDLQHLLFGLDISHEMKV